MTKLQATPTPDTETLSDRAYRQLRRGLKAGAYKPGEKLTNRAVAAALGVSLTPVREAMARLVSERGLIMAGPKTVIVPRLSVDQYEEIFNIRLSLEGMATEMAAANADRQFIDDLEAAHMAFAARRSVGDFAGALELNQKFHFMLYERANQPRLLSMIDTLWVSLGPSLSLLYPKYGKSDDGVRPHSDAIAALRRGAAAEVRAAIENDLATGRTKVLQFLADQAKSQTS